ncbi:zinc-binding dehydrogenase [Solidesulfovibrio sp.]|uniref:quinone oxidoreductase family protein n=1 Tax=Solidesulfovibrio sp. TaxID=2910990 RepID=UPI002611FE65|nr:zinc-binding dehydrogenase [Solidesulfovibrio sp.]
MFAVYVETPNPDAPLEALRLGQRPEPEIPPGWTRVAVSHASLNRHDVFTLRGVTGHPTPIPFPMILGNDGVGRLDDGTEVVLYPLVTGPGRRGDETLAPDWHVLSEKVQGTFAEYVAVPRENVLPLPPGLSAVDASVLGTAWLTAYRSLFTRARLKPGQTVLVQGATGGMSTALIQLGRAAGLTVWATSRSRRGLEMAERLGAHVVLPDGAPTPGKADAVCDNVGAATFGHSLRSLARGGVLVVTGVTAGQHVPLDLLPLIVNQVSVVGSIMGTLEEMRRLMDFVVGHGIRPEIDAVVPLDQARGAFERMVRGEVAGKLVLAV